MFVFGNPVCPQTQQRVAVFCSTPNCTSPAFGCSEQCLSSHVDHTIRQWSLVEKPVQLLIDLPLSPADVKTLEEQEKSIKILIEEMKVILENHWRYMKESRKRLQLKGAVKKVLESIQDKKTSSVTGGDMAELMRQLKDNDVFLNYQSIGRAVSLNNTLVNGLVKKMKILVDEHRQNVQLRSNLEQPYIHPIVDLKNINKDRVLLINDVITVKPEGQWKNYPIFAEEPAYNNYIFHVEVVAAANKYFFIGVASSDLRNTIDTHMSKSSICLHAGSGNLFVNGAKQNTGKTLNTGDKVSVQVSGYKILWLKGESTICQTHIPSHLSSKKLFPVIWIWSESSGKNISKLRFL